MVSIGKSNSDDSMELFYPVCCYKGCRTCPFAKPRECLQMATCSGDRTLCFSVLTLVVEKAE